MTRINKQQMYDMLTFFRELDRHVVAMDIMRGPKDGNTLSECFIDMFTSFVGSDLGVTTFQYLFRSPEKDCFDYKLEKDEWIHMDKLSKIGTIENSDNGFVFSYDFGDDVLEDDLLFIDFLEIIKLIDCSDINVGLSDIEID